MLKPNASTMVGQLYAQGDQRRDSGFSIFYMGINLGGLLAPLACGWVGERIGWRLGFGLAGLGMVAGLIQYTLGGKYLGSAGLHPAPPASPEAGRRLKRNAASECSGGRADSRNHRIARGDGPIGAYRARRIRGAGPGFDRRSRWESSRGCCLGPGWSPIERKRSGAILVLFVASSVFWAAYEQAGSSLSLFRRAQHESRGAGI